MKAANMIGMVRNALTLVVVGGLLNAAAPASLPAQALSAPGATRAELTAQADSLQRLIASGSLKSKDRDARQLELYEIRQRLQDGDFRVGDRFLYTVNGDKLLADSASVREDLSVAISSLPDVSMKGVLRSELTDHLATHVARYLKNTSVRTTILTRVQVIGGVARQGFYYLPPDRAITEVVMVAGGPVEKSNLNELEVKRNGRVIISTKASREALREGRTLEQMDIRSGDEVRIPLKSSRKFNWSQVLQFVFVISSLVLAFVQFLTWYYREQ